ncbi:MAG: carboxymuconolactone decarboxylase family protein [Gammaproteobacteria bacterium]|nr:carboxymuconolactone decarboxylase family protein [Gammaproteobacteria bacterium]
MNKTVFQDKVFPRHISDLMSLMQMMVFDGTDGEEKWDTYLSLKQKEYVALGISQYYQCDFCIEHHTKAVLKVDKVQKNTLEQNINSIILFLRIDTRTVTKSETAQWINSWKKFSRHLSVDTNDNAMPYLIGFSVGIARNDEFLIHFCGEELKLIFAEKNIELSKVIGELEAVVIFMKAAVSKNRIVDKINTLLE